MPDNQIQLKYLFAAEFTDGVILKQTPEDRSFLDPTKSCFYDVLNSGKTVRRFSLIGDGNTITVDLGNGIFYVNGLPLLIESDRLPRLPSRFDLIFYHQVSQSMNVTVDKSNGQVTKTEPLNEYREYFIGWKCNLGGKSYQQKIAVS